MIWKIGNHLKSSRFTSLAFCCLLAFLGSVFISSSSASAVVLSQDVDYVETLSAPRFDGILTDNSVATVTNNNVGMALQNYHGKNLKRIYSTNSFRIIKDQYYTLTISVMSLNPTGMGAQTVYFFPSDWWYITDSDNFQFVSIEETVKDDMPAFMLNNGNDITPYEQKARTEITYKSYTLTLRAKTTGTFPIVIGNNSSTLFRNGSYGAPAEITVDYLYINPNIGVYKNSVSDVSGAIEQQTEQQQQQYNEQKEKEEQQEQDLQDSSSDAEAEGQSASDEANEVGTSLFAGFTTLVASLHTVHITNCKLPNFTVQGLEFKDMDLCMFSTPSGLMALGAVGMIFIIVPLGISLVRQLIALYNEIIGGKS